MNRTGERWMAVGAVAFWAMTTCFRLEGAPLPPAPPQVFLETSLDSTPVSGKTIQVAAGGDFQAALDAAQPGDEIVLQAGDTYTGNFVLPAKNGGRNEVAQVISRTAQPTPRH